MSEQVETGGSGTSKRFETGGSRMSERFVTGGSGTSERAETGAQAGAGAYRMSERADAGGLAGALAAEEAAIYAYGLIGVNLAGDTDRTEARAAEAVHRGRRDVLVSRLAELRASAAPAPAGYDLPFPVTDRASALKLAVRIEEGVAQAWRAAMPGTADTDRATAVDALTDAAVRATRWRRLADITPLTIPFPGRAG